MDKNILKIIRSNPHIYNFLRDESHHYKYLLADSNYIREIDRLAKEKYHLRFTDKIDSLSNNLELLKTFLDII